MLQSICQEDGVVMLIEAVFDESGTGDKDLAHVLAGYVIKPDHGLEMSRRWKVILDRYGLEFFHMTDCAAYQRCEPYKSLGRDKCIMLATKLIKLIKKHCLCGFAICFNPRTYEIVPDKTVNTDNHYSFSINIAHLQIQEVLRTLQYEGALTYMLEAGHAKQKHARKVLDQLTSNSELTNNPFSFFFLRKTEANLLQAADILAWHCQSYIKGRVSNRAIRKDFLSLLEIPHRVTHISNTMIDGKTQLNGSMLLIDENLSSETSVTKEELVAIYTLGGINYLSSPS